MQDKCVERLVLLKAGMTKRYALALKITHGIGVEGAIVAGLPVVKAFALQE